LLYFIVAIKTGRYTHQKRTEDTIELKTLQGCPVTTPPQKILETLVSPTPLEIPEYDRKIRDITNAFRLSFPETTYLHEHAKEVYSIVGSIMKEHNMKELDTVIFHKRGTDPEDDITQLINANAEIMENLSLLDQSASTETLVAEGGVKATRKLFEVWSLNVDRFIRNLVRFSKKIDGFSEISRDDQISLIKYGRAEVSSLVKFQHFANPFKACIDCRLDRNELSIFPHSVLNKIFIDGESNEQRAAFTHNFTR